MKENKYDDQTFFEKYSQMSRSTDGLEGAGEWGTLQQMLPDFEGKSVLDLGCGYGWHCIYAAERGAKSVIGIDLSEKMLEKARKKTSFPQVEYQCLAMEDVDFPAETFDVVLSSLAFHYLASFEDMAKRIHNMLKPGGSFIFNVEHPVFTAQGPQSWHLDDNGEILHFPVDNYFYEGKRNAMFLGEDVIKYHRTMTTYLKTLLVNGFEIIDFEEPKPSQEMIENIDGMKDEMRRPMMMIISAVKR